MKIKIYLAILTCVLGSFALTGCNQDSSTTTAPSTNAIPAMPSTNMPSTNH